MHENRETSGAPRPAREGGRSAKAQSHTADAHALEESDRAIVSMSQANKEERSSAEPGERRARAKENIVPFNTHPTQRGERVFQRWSGVRGATLRVTHPRWEPYAVMPLVRFLRGAISNDRPYRDQCGQLEPDGSSCFFALNRNVDRPGLSAAHQKNGPGTRAIAPCSR